MQLEDVKQSTVTMVEQQKRSKRRYNIYVDDEYAFAVHEDIMLKHQLLKGAIIDAAKIVEVTHAEERHAAYLRALRLLGRRPHARKELERKLKEAECESAAIEHALDKLAGEGYVDDDSFAKQFAEHRVNFSRKGRLFIRQELKQKGVGKDAIAQAMDELDSEAEYEAALVLACRKWNGTRGEKLDKKRKTMAFLLRRGFPQSIVQRALREAERLAAENVDPDDEL